MYGMTKIFLPQDSATRSAYSKIDQSFRILTRTFAEMFQKLHLLKILRIHNILKILYCFSCKILLTNVNNRNRWRFFLFFDFFQKYLLNSLMTSLLLKFTSKISDMHVMSKIFLPQDAVTRSAYSKIDESFRILMRTLAEMSQRLHLLKFKNI